MSEKFGDLHPPGLSYQNVHLSKLLRAIYVQPLPAGNQLSLSGPKKSIDMDNAPDRSATKLSKDKKPPPARRK